MKKKLKIVASSKQEIKHFVDRIKDFPNHINQFPINQNILEKKLIFFFNKKKLNTIWSDNIKVGFIIKNFKKKHIFFDFFAYSFKYFNLSELINLNLFDKKDFFKRSELIKKKFSKLQLSQKRIEFNSIKKMKNRNILILGPKIRNKNIRKKLLKIGYKVKIYNQVISLKFLKKGKFNFIISSGYPFKISEQIIKEFNKRIINLHATFLPWGKGIGTTFFSYLLHQPTGISIHYINNKFDTGDIICRLKVNEKSNDTTRSFYKKLLKNLEKLFISKCDKILRNKIKTVSQKTFKLQTKYFSRFQFEKVIRLLPNGYDTKLYELHNHGILIKKNIELIKFLIR